MKEIIITILAILVLALTIFSIVEINKVNQLQEENDKLEDYSSVISNNYYRMCKVVNAENKVIIAYENLLDVYDLYYGNKANLPKYDCEELQWL